MWKFRIFALIVLVSLFVVVSCSQDASGDKEISDYQYKLLETAFKTASKIPSKPHIKDKSKTQQMVVMTCLSINQPNLALKYINEISNWRKGVCYAELAYYFAEKGQTDKVQKFLDMAEVTASENIDDKRSSRIKVKIAQTYTFLKQNKQSQNFQRDLEEFDTGKVAQTKAIIADANSFEQQISFLDELIAIGSFDVTKNALNAYIQLYNRFYSEPDKRDFIKEKIISSWRPIPIPIRVELLVKLAQFAVSNDDPNNATAILELAQQIIDEHKWLPQTKIPMIADVAKVRFAAGDKDKAIGQVDELWNLYNANSEKITNIYRAGILRPLAQAYKSMDKVEKSLMIYKRAVEEGIANPNSRPRAEDLAATCCSMALNEVEPDAQLWSRINQIYEELGQPW